MSKRVEYKTANSVGYIELPGDATEAKVTGFTVNEKPTKKKKEDDEPQINEEEPMLPILLDDPAPDTKKKATGTENEDILMPTSF